MCNARKYDYLRPVIILVLIIAVSRLTLFCVKAEEIGSLEKIAEDVTEENLIFIEGDNLLLGSANSEEDSSSDIITFSLPTSGITVAVGEKINEFNTNKYPEVTCNLKYIANDGNNGDSRNENGQLRRRYVYCLEHFKNAPINQSFTMSGYENAKVYHVIYNGAMYYGENSRNPAHSTGNWKHDYLATQMSVSIIRDEFSLDEVIKSVQKSPAAESDKSKLIQAITNMVKDAISYGGIISAGFDSNGWFRMDKTENYNFQLKNESTKWNSGNDGYFYTGWITPVLTSSSGYYSNGKISYLKNIISENGVEIEKKYNDSIHSPYRLKVKETLYYEWKQTGKTVTSRVNIQVPAKWKAAVFIPGNNVDFQKITFPVFENDGTYASYSAEISFEIPKEIIKYNLQIEKSNDVGDLLDGVSFTIFQDGELELPIQEKITRNGLAKFEGLESNKTYYLAETNSAAGYSESNNDRIIVRIFAEVDNEGKLKCYVNDILCSEDKNNENDFYCSIVDGLTTIYLDVINPIGKRLPETGSKNMIVIIVMGICLMSISLNLKERILNEK